MRCNKKYIEPEYLSWWFKFNCENKTFADIEGAKSTIAHLPGVKLKALKVVVPELLLQKRFAEFLRQVDKSKAAAQESLAKLETLKASLMQQFFG